MSAPPPSAFCWFDYETFGTSPRWDRPAQFASIRTDAELEIVAEPVVLHCRQAEDYLPHPGACRVTGLDPETVNGRGLPEHRFIDAVRTELGASGTCSVGYNSIRFDDEVTRHTLWRNLRDPYAHEWQGGSSRWDLIDVVRLTRALRPDGIEWPVIDGRPSNRLEHLAAANALEQGRAHDALADVRATIALARLIRARHPRLFAWTLAHRDKRSLRALLDPARAEPRLLVAPTIPAARHHLASVVPIAPHPTNASAVIVLDLGRDPEALVGLDAAEIAARVFAPALAADDPTRLGLHAVALNRCPIVVPRSTMRAEDAERLGVDRDAEERRLRSLETLLEAPLLARVGEAFAARGGAGGGDGRDVDVDASLYAGGFLSEEDRLRLAELRAADPCSLARAAPRFDDPRLEELLFRYRARNHPETLDADERARWRAHVNARLDAEGEVPWLTREGFARAIAAETWREEEASLRAALERYAPALS